MAPPQELDNGTEVVVFEPQERHVFENTGGGVAVGDPLIASDPDAGQDIRFTLLEDSAQFSIDEGTGQISVRSDAEIDYEMRATYVLGVRVKDDGIVGSTRPGIPRTSQALDAVANVTIAIHDRNERPVISDTSRTIFENATIGTELGDAFTATDVDAGQTLTYIITSGAFDSEGRRTHFPRST